MSKLSEKVLGYLYNAEDDRICVKFVFNPAKKRKGAEFKPDLTMDDVDIFFKTSESSRLLLTICNAVYDPLGLVTLFTIKLKILMKQTVSIDNLGDCDSSVLDCLNKEWSSVLKEAISQNSLYFPL